MGYEWGSDVVVIPSDEVQSDHWYYLAVQCLSSCTYNLLVSHVTEVELVDGVPQDYTMTLGQVEVFVFEVDNPRVDHIRFTAVPSYGDILMEVNIDTVEGSSLSVQQDFVNGHTATISDQQDVFCNDCRYLVTIMANNDT